MRMQGAQLMLTKLRNAIIRSVPISYRFRDKDDFIWKCV